MKNVRWMIEILENLTELSEKLNLSESHEALYKANSVLKEEISDREFLVDLATMRARRSAPTSIPDASHLRIVE